MIRIVIADDDYLVLKVLKMNLEQDEEIEICGLASNGREAFDLCAKEHPDLVLMDLRMPGYDGDKATKDIKRVYPHIKILILTTFDDQYSIRAIISSGADGYILKSVDDDNLPEIIKCSMAGVRVLNAEVFSEMKEKLYPRQEDIHPLTERERTLLSHIASGLSNKEIAGEMQLSDGTLRNYISRLLDKLGMNDRTQLAVFAVQHGLG